jgi:hypothetical protein
MASPGMVDGQSGVLGHAVLNVVVGREYRHAPARIQSPIYMAKTVLGTTHLKVNAITSNVEKSHQVSYYICNQTIKSS